MADAYSLIMLSTPHISPPFHLKSPHKSVDSSHRNWPPLMKNEGLVSVKVEMQVFFSFL